MGWRHAPPPRLQQAHDPGTNTAVCSCRSDNKVTIHFINRDGEKVTAKGSPGDTLLDVVVNEDLDFDGFGMKVHAVM